MSATNKLILSGCLVINTKREILLLYRKDHQHYETPGGKVNQDECLNPKNPTLEELAKAAQRELHEEVSRNIKIKTLVYLKLIPRSSATVGMRLFRKVFRNIVRFPKIKIL